MVTKFKAEDHKLILLGEVEFSQGLWAGECSCSNTDGEGTGLVVFTAYTLSEVMDSWLDHYFDKMEEANA